MTKLTVTASAELMENFIHSEYLLPQKRFLSLQTDIGASLLFSIGSTGAMALTIEVPGQTHGWRQVDLSSVQIQNDFAGKATVKTFSAAQVPAVAGGAPARINLAMVVTDGTSDHLYLCLDNPDADLAWTDKPTWTAAAFNAVDGTGKPITPVSPFQIADVMIAEATDTQYIAVDTIRNPGQTPGMIDRFYIDTKNPAQPVWQMQDLPIDVEAASYMSCLGRAAKSHGVDGLYTNGKIGTSAQLVYVPLYNVFDTTVPRSPPPASRLGLPGGIIGDAIAAVRNADNNTDLFVAAQGALFWFASDNQKDGATAIKVADSPLLGTVTRLFATLDDGHVVVWGLNASNQVFYLACPLGQQGQINAWSRPLPILTQVDAISPFIDRAYSAKTFFAQSGTGLVKLVKSPTTGLWDQRPITLPQVDSAAASQSIHSYTTHIRVTDDQQQTVANQTLTISATNVTSVYINHLYYIVGPRGIAVQTDALGTVTIVETANSLAGTRYDVSVGAQAPVPVNTMDTAFQRNAAYTTSDSLTGAKIVARDGKTRPFLPSNTPNSAINSVAQSNQSLAKAYASLAAKPAAPMLRAHLPIGAAVAKPAAFQAAGFGNALLTDIGDLFNWLASGVASLIQLVEDVATGFWHLVVTIGKAVYHAALDCIEAVMAAATWIYDAIKVAVSDVLDFLQFLFGWQDILVTHKVLKNVFLRMSENAISSIDETKMQIAEVFQTLEHELNQWANLPDFDQTSASVLTSHPAPDGQHGAPANLGVHHFQGNCDAGSSDIPATSTVEALFDDLLKLVEAEGDTLSAAATMIKTEIIDKFSTLSLTQIMQKFLAIVGDLLLQSAENILLTLLNIFQDLLDGVIGLLTAKLNIPVLSWLYKDLTGEDLSFLDLMCLIAAIPGTIVYKIAAKKTPFPADDAFTKGLIAAQTFDEVQALFLVTPAVPVRNPAGMARPVLMGMAAAAGDETPPPTTEPAVLDQARLKTFGFVTGLVSFAGSVVLVVVTNAQRLLDGAISLFNEGAPLTNSQIKMRMGLATIACAGNVAYVSPNIATLVNARTGNWYATFNNVITCLCVLKSMAAIPAAASNNTAVSYGFAFAETGLNVIWNVPVIANIVANESKAFTTYKSLIPESIGNFAFNVGGILELPIAAVKGGSTPQLVMIGGQVFLMLSYGVCMSVAGGIYQFVDNQEH